MGWFDGKLASLRSMLSTLSNTLQDDSNQAQAYDEVTNRPHEAKWSHELIGGAAAYEAAKAYEDHVARNGTFPTRPSLVEDANTRTCQVTLLIMPRPRRSWLVSLALS